MKLSSSYDREQAALRLDPWGDGKGDDRYLVLRNKIVVTRRPADCALCFQPIPIGSRVRAQTEQSNDYGVKTFKFCPACVDAMAAYSLEDDIKPLEARYRLGMSVADNARAALAVESAKSVPHASVSVDKHPTDPQDSKA